MLDDYYNCECPICGKLFHLKPSQKAKNKYNCCSMECSKKLRSIRMTGEGNHQYGLKGDKNASWKSDTMVKNGYIFVRVPDHPFRDRQDFVLEHRLVAEKYLLNDENSVEVDGKKYLSPDYVVHHKDFNRTNNRVENLQVMTFEDHVKLHNALNPHNRDDYDGRFLASRKNTIHAKRTTMTAILPARATDGSAGYDMCVDSDKDVTIPPHSTVMFSSGIALEIPRGYVGLIYARSGKSTKEGIRPSTCVSVIDSDYRGNIGLPLYNDSDVSRTVKPYERVAQLLFQPVIAPKLVVVDELDETFRGENGFGSTGSEENQFYCGDIYDTEGNLLCKDW